jgi:hypothetical protein
MHPILDVEFEWHDLPIERISISTDAVIIDVTPFNELTRAYDQASLHLLQPDSISFDFVGPLSAGDLGRGLLEITDLEFIDSGQDRITGKLGIIPGDPSIGYWEVCFTNAIGLVVRPAVSFLDIEVVWHDPNLIEVCVKALNGSYSGQTNVYVGIGGLAKAADQLRGFPTSPRDERRLCWGSLERSDRLGQADLLFRCRDGAGHAVLVADLVSSDMGKAEPGQSVSLKLPIEAAAVDRFIAALRVVEQAKRGVARLEGAR